MTTVGVAKLKASLSAYLARVKAGQEVVVTEHGRPIARLVPIDDASNDAHTHLRELERAGLLRRGTGGIREALAQLRRPDDPAGLSLRALLTERDEGR